MLINADGCKILKNERQTYLVQTVAFKDILWLKAAYREQNDIDCSLLQEQTKQN